MQPGYQVQDSECKSQEWERIWKAGKSSLSLSYSKNCLKEERIKWRLRAKNTTVSYSLLWKLRIYCFGIDCCNNSHSFPNLLSQISLSHQLIHSVSSEGLPKNIFKEVDKTLIAFKQIQSLQKSAQSFKLPLPPKASLSVWIFKYWDRIFGTISRSHLQFYKPASIYCSTSIHKSSTLAHEYRGVFSSTHLLNLEKNGNKYDFGNRDLWDTSCVFQYSFPCPL